MDDSIPKPELRLQAATNFTARALLLLGGAAAVAALTCLMQLVLPKVFIYIYLIGALQK
jgi:hypothetical protein